MKRVALIAVAAVAVLAVMGVGISQALQDDPSGATTAALAREQSFSVAEAGAVTVSVQSGRISVVSIQRVEGWTPKVVRQSGPSVRVDFVKGAARREFVAQFADGELSTRVSRINGQSTSSSVSSSSVSSSSVSSSSVTSSSVTSSTGATSSTVDDDATSTTFDDNTSTTFDDETTSTTIDDDATSTTFDDATSTTFDDDVTSTTFDDNTSTTIDDDTTSTTVREETPPADRTVTYQVADAGSVTVRIADGQLVLLDVNANAGWNVEVEDGGGDRVRVEFERGDDDVEFRLQFHGSELRLEIG